MGIRVRRNAAGTLEVAPSGYQDAGSIQSAAEFSDSDDNLHYLRHLTDDDAIRDLRTLLGNDGHVSAYRLSDVHVLRQAATMLSRRVSVSYQHDGSTEEPARVVRSVVPVRAETPEPAPPRRSPPRQASSPPTPVPVEPGPFDNLDQSAQVAVLLQAAADGAPFCEECAKAARGHAA